MPKLKEGHISPMPAEDVRIVAAVARKIGAVQAADDFLERRAGTSARGDLSRLLDKAPDTPALPEDDLAAR